MTTKKAGRRSAPKGHSHPKKKSRRRAGNPFQLPDNSDLKGVDPTSKESVQPGWIGKHHPEYVAHDAMHQSLSSVRQFHYAGHEVMIRTSYEIEVDGTPVQLHAIVDDEGQLRCHTTPYETYSTATELVKELIFRFPDSFEDLGGGDAEYGDTGGGHHDHGGMHS